MKFYPNSSRIQYIICLCFCFRLGKRIMDILQDTDVVAHSDYTTKSRNYKLGVTSESMQASIQGNVIFDPSNQLPKEVLLETTLEAFGYSMDIWEVCMSLSFNDLLCWAPFCW